MIKLEPVRIGREFQWTSCIDDCIATVCKFYGLEYRFAYPQTWEFIYTSGKHTETLKLIDRINIDNVANRYGFLEKYHHIKMNYHYVQETDEILEIVKRELSANRPVSIKMDSYNIPWDYHYKILHTNHVCMPVDIDEGSGLIKVIDPYNMKTDLFFPIVQLKEAGGFCITYDIDREKNVDFDASGMFRDAVYNLLRKKDGMNSFDLMRLFAEDFLRDFDINTEIVDNNGQLDWGDFNAHFMHLGFGRSLFQITMKYVAQRYGIDEMLQLSPRFRRMISKWTIIITIMQRTFRSLKENSSTTIKTDINRMIETVHKILLESADYEEQTAQKLLDIMDSLGKVPVLGVLDSKEISDKAKERQCVCLKLEEHFNNKAFGGPESHINADFTGDGEFLLFDDMTKNSVWSYEDITFRMAEIEKSRYDNISCSEQIIDFEPVMCNKICFLGNAEWGSFFEAVTLWNTNGEIEEVNLGFSNHAYDIIYGEKIAWGGKSAKLQEGKVEIFQPEAKIFFVSCELGKAQEINRIKLPLCTNMHIFAITLLLT